MRHLIVRCAAVLSAISLAASVAHAEDYPQSCGTLKIIVPYGAGGPNDTMARVFAEGLKRDFNMPVIVENRPGVAGTRAPAEFAIAATKRMRDKAAPEECTLMHIGDTPFDPRVLKYYGYEKDALMAVSLTGMYFPMWIIAAAHPFEVSGMSPVSITNTKQLLAFAKIHPGVLNYTGAGSTSAFCGQEFIEALGIKMINVLYRSEKEGITDIITGRTHISCAFQLNTREMVKAKQLTVFATTAASRDPEFPDVPTIRELGNELHIDELKQFPRFDIWGMIVADPGMNAVHRKRIADALCRIGQQQATRELFKKMMITPAPCGTVAAEKAVQTAYDTLGIRPDPIPSK